MYKMLADLFQAVNHCFLLELREPHPSISFGHIIACILLAVLLKPTMVLMTSTFFSEGGGRNFTSGNTAINQLQEWCRRRTKYHEVCFSF